jgi:hypothetical protein
VAGAGDGTGLLTLLIGRWYGVERSAAWVEYSDKALVAAVTLWFVYAMVRRAAPCL